MNFTHLYKHGQIHLFWCKMDYKSAKNALNDLQFGQIPGFGSLWENMR